jgi:1,1a-dihydroxy-1-hydro-9-fluorenone dehydrogenase
VLPCDITADAEIDAAFDRAMKRFGRVDVLVNNAAMRQRDLYPVAGACAVLDTEDAHWKRMFAVNVIGTLKLTRRFVRPMLAQRRGSVIMVSANGSLTQAVEAGVSVGNHPGLLNQPYDASKAALTSLSFYLAEEVKGANVAVNVIFPGATRTTGSDDLTPGREALGLKMDLLPAEHVVPVCLMLAQADAASTGRAYDVVPWNAAHGRAAAA